MVSFALFMVNLEPPPPASGRSPDLLAAQIGGGVAGLVFVGLAVTGAVALYGEIRSVTAWRTVEGVVVRSEIDADVETATAEVGPTLGAAFVTYEYTVDGRLHSAARVAPLLHRSSRRGAGAAVVARYPEGRRVTVHFDPSEPTTALLEPGISWLSVLFLVLGLAGTCGGAVIGRRLLR